MLFSIIWAGLSVVAGANSQSRQPYTLRTCLMTKNLHRDDFKLFANFFTDGIFAAVASASQFMLGQFVDNFDTRQIGRQRFAFATAPGRCNDFFVAGLIQGFGEAFRFVEERQLWRRRIACPLGLAPGRTLAQQRNFLFEMKNLALVGRGLVDPLLKQLLEQNRIVREVFGHGNHAADLPNQATYQGVKT
ncbi:hypothetical protein SAMN05216185_103162 [Pseudomonas guariconensis]|uniref:Uncharacterized protein n=1 Tax=Pseudomonas putida TaxID=303 RepID=A0A6S5TLJ4_PSEPU|nr:hypothetical protein WP8W18C01_36910 [Pseudomonas putida]SDC54163.1 hypothetical protein SAMN05216185_103162 [Pseudomonas guariconensis]